MVRFLVSSYLDVDDSFSKAGAMISYSGGLFLFCFIIFGVLVVSIVVFACTDHPENDTVSKEKKKIQPKSSSGTGANYFGGGIGSMIMYSGGAAGGGGGCGGGDCGFVGGC
ncbi:hypothetical protein HAX54_024180 [Datura stramonium]|uniref:Glycine-rich protein n=1 Tax=Datura stramonium TaxID=4076 RepID=A0ABS8V022_DATST|nr:hypothetical protein [Datura stramonium]